jgi:hypothetical protein
MRTLELTLGKRRAHCRALRSASLEHFVEQGHGSHYAPIRFYPLRSAQGFFSQLDLRVNGTFFPSERAHPMD